MPNETIRLDFNGREIVGERIVGEVWFTAERVATLLGYETADEVNRLCNRHKSEFMPHESMSVTLTGIGGKPRRHRVYSLDGIDHLAILSKTDVGVAARRWVIDTRAKLRAGTAGFVTRDQLIEIVTRSVEAAVSAARAESATHIAALMQTVKSLAGALEVSTSNAAKLLAHVRHHPEVTVAQIEEREREVMAMGLFRGRMPTTPN